MMEWDQVYFTDISRKVNWCSCLTNMNLEIMQKAINVKNPWVR